MKILSNRKKNLESQTERTWVMLTLMILKSQEPEWSALPSSSCSGLGWKQRICDVKSHWDLWMRSGFWASGSAHEIHLPLSTAWCSWGTDAVLGGMCSLGKAGTCPSGRNQGQASHSRYWDAQKCHLLELGKARVCLVGMLEMCFVKTLLKEKNFFTSSDFRSHLTFAEGKGCSPMDFGPKAYLLHSMVSAIFYHFAPSKYGRACARSHLSPFGAILFCTSLTKTGIWIF